MGGPGFERQAGRQAEASSPRPHYTTHNPPPAWVPAAWTHPTERTCPARCEAPKQHRLPRRVKRCLKLLCTQPAGVSHDRDGRWAAAAANVAAAPAAAAGLMPRGYRRRSPCFRCCCCCCLCSCLGAEAAGRPGRRRHKGREVDMAAVPAPAVVEVKGQGGLATVRAGGQLHESTAHTSPASQGHGSSPAKASPRRPTSAARLYSTSEEKPGTGTGGSRSCAVSCGQPAAGRWAR